MPGRTGNEQVGVYVAVRDPPGRLESAHRAPRARRSDAIHDAVRPPATATTRKRDMRSSRISRSTSCSERSGGRDQARLTTCARQALLPESASADTHQRHIRVSTTARTSKAAFQQLSRAPEACRLQRRTEQSAPPAEPSIALRKALDELIQHGGDFADRRLHIVIVRQPRNDLDQRWLHLLIRRNSVAIIREESCVHHPAVHAAGDGQTAPVSFKRDPRAIRVQFVAKDRAALGTVPPRLVPFSKGIQSVIPDTAVRCARSAIPRQDDGRRPAEGECASRGERSSRGRSRTPL